MKGLHIADFACGTGTLLTTAYQRIGQLHELASGDSEALHAYMMAESLIGADVLPAASHLTASMLSGAHPTVTYGGSRILTVKYGLQPKGNIALGSIDLLDEQKQIESFDITAKAVGGKGETETEQWLPHEAFDFVVMNPPFVRPTGHEGKKIGVPVPMFAAFSSTEEEQYMMSKAMKRLTRGTSYHGNAGEASAFLAIADRKLKMGGTVALVMPLSLMMGEAWEASRAVLAKNYAGIILVSIAGAKDEDMSFSADTDMGECLFVGRKEKDGSARGTFVILKERPKSTLIGSTIAVQIHRSVRDKKLRMIEDGPMGGTPLFFGDEIVGYALDAPLPDDGGAWNLARIADLSLAQAAHQIIHGTVWLPAMQKTETVELPMTRVHTIAKIGPYHADINFKNTNGTVRGPFDIRDIKPGSVPTYPVLWKHDADRERTMCFEGESEAQHKKGKNTEERELIDLKAAAVWASASHCHFNQNFRFNSQSTGIQFTPRRTIGGRAWTSVALASEDQEKAVVLWGNPTLGVLLHWYHSNKQQSGRGNITPTALESLAVWDVTALPAAQLEKAVRLFDEMCHKSLLPIYETNKDRVRKELDEKFCLDVLGMSKSTVAPGGALDVLRMKLAREPSIRGTK